MTSTHKSSTLVHGFQTKAVRILLEILVPLIRIQCMVPIRMRAFRLHFMVSIISWITSKQIVNPFRFSSSGTQIKVFGSNNIRNDSGVLDPTWQCFVDNISIGASAPFQFAENNWEFCEQDKLVDGPHILTVNATVLKNQTFWIDNIQYVPSASVSLNQKAIVVDNLDPQLQYGQGWQALGGTANMTTVPGSIFLYNFIGM